MAQIITFRPDWKECVVFAFGVDYDKSSGGDPGTDTEAFPMEQGQCSAPRLVGDTQDSQVQFTPSRSLSSHSGIRTLSILRDYSPL